MSDYGGEQRNPANSGGVIAPAGSACSLRMGLEDWAYLATFVVVNLILRLFLLRINEAEYTDGILQLTVFSNKAGLYPPLYGALARALRTIVGSEEQAGRVVSAVAASLALIPIYLFTVRLSRPCAARFTALFYTLCPLILRWSIRVMTDSLFLALSAGALFAFQKSYEARRDHRMADRYLAVASVLAACSALTRYQGAFLALFVFVQFVALAVRSKTIPWRTLLLSAVWGLLPLWMMTHGFVHQAQFTQRTTGQWISTLLAWLNLGESFVLIFPYYLGWPIFFFALAGLARVDWGTPERRFFLVTWSAWAFIILVLQSMFGSFQYRYMMPIFPAAIALAGAGASWLEWRLIARRRGWIFSVLLICSLSYLVLFSSAVLIFQRKSFGDQKAAAEFVRKNIPPASRVLANERYGDFLSLGCVKLSYWSERPIEPIFSYLPQRPGQPLPKIIPPGSHVVLGNVYGGDEFVDYLTAILTYYYHMRYVASFDATVYPLMDDVMVNPVFNQNPLAWVMRYTPQLFSTHIYIVDGIRTSEELGKLRERQLPIPVPPGTDKSNSDPTQRTRSSTSNTHSFMQTKP